MTDTPPAIVAITDVYGHAVKIKARDLLVTDKVHDIFGGTHNLAWVRKYKHVVRFKRDDLPYADGMAMDDTITVIRGAAS